jgi:hypothetical protein
LTTSFASARFATDCAKIHLSTLTAAQAGGCELFCSDSGRTKAQADNDQNANPKKAFGL